MDIEKLNIYVSSVLTDSLDFDFDLRQKYKSGLSKRKDL